MLFVLDERGAIGFKVLLLCLASFLSVVLSALFCSHSLILFVLPPFRTFTFCTSYLLSRLALFHQGFSRKSLPVEEKPVTVRDLLD